MKSLWSRSCSRVGETAAARGGRRAISQVNCLGVVAINMPVGDAATAISDLWGTGSVAESSGTVLLAYFRTTGASASPPRRPTAELG